MSQIHRRIGDRYELVGGLGTSASRTVWHGRDELTGADVAIKVLRPELTADPAALSGLRSTLAALARLGHPGILAVTELVELDDRIALVSGFLAGGSLRSRLARRGPLPLDRSVSMMAGVCRTLGAVHEIGVAHGGLTPSQLRLIPDRPAAEEALLADFGMAALVNRAVAAGLLPPVPALQYQAPEISAGQPGTAAADVYAVGVLLYETLTGHRPFPEPRLDDAALAAAETQTAEMAAVPAHGRMPADQPPLADQQAPADEPPPASVTPPIAGLPAALWRTILCCLTPDPEERPTADELAGLLTRFGPPAPFPAQTPLSSPPPLPAQRSRPPSLSPSPAPSPSPSRPSSLLPPPSFEDDATVFMPVIRPDTLARATAAVHQASRSGPPGGPNGSDGPSDPDGSGGHRHPLTTRRRAIQAGAAASVLAVALVLGITALKPGGHGSVPEAGVPILADPGGGSSALGNPAAGGTQSARSSAKASGSPSVTASASGSTASASAKAGAAGAATTPASGTSASASTSASAALANMVTGSTSGSALKNAYSGSCLDTAGTFANNIPEQITTCTGTAAETWTLTSAGALTQDGAAYCLDDYDWGSTPGSKVVLWACNGGTNQQWTLRSDGTILGTSSGLCLDLAGPSAANGTAVQLSTCGQASNQKWSWLS